jgi:GH15 family glucan-1,4-alpha-glucosidase
MKTRGRFAIVLWSALMSALAQAAPAPVPSIGALTTGNGFGFQVFDLSQKKITQFLERPYRYLRPGATLQSTGVERRNLAYDVYFGLRAGTVGSWLKDVPQTEVGYVAQTGTIRTVGSVNGVKGESYFFAPFGYSGNAVIALLHVTNTSGAPLAVDVFLNPNFHMGSGTGDTVGAENETIANDIETGPGGGAMVYQPFGVDRSDCSGTGYARVMSGMDLLGTPTTCTNQNDVTIVYQKSLGTLAAGADAWWGAAISFAPDGNGAAAKTAMSAWLNGRAPKQLLDDAGAEWNAWRKPPPSGLSSDEAIVWRQAEAVLRMSQVREPWQDAPKHKAHGMLLASLPPGQWHIGWVRDATFATVALARMGHLDEARDALAFFLDAEANKYQSYTGVPYRISVVRYFGDGQEESDWNTDGPNIEFDGWGLYLWAARAFVDAAGAAWLDGSTRAGETIYDVLRDQIAAPLDRNREASGLVGKDTSIWESHWNNRRHYAFTSLTAARGLCDFASLADRHNDHVSAETYRKASEAAKAAVRANLLDGQLVLGGSLEGIAAGKYHDGAVLWGFNWSLFSSSDPVTTATLDGLTKLQVSTGGYMRNDDFLSSYDSDEWIMIDLSASAAMRRAGRSKADDLVAWVTAQARANQDLIPELYNNDASAGTLGAYKGAIPMVGFGAASYVLALLDRAGAAPLATDCAATASSDGGTSSNDGGTSSDDGGIVGFDLTPTRGGSDGGTHRGSSGCSCDLTGAPNAPIAPWLSLALVAVLLTVRSSRRARAVPEAVSWLRRRRI